MHPCTSEEFSNHPCMKQSVAEFDQAHATHGEAGINPGGGGGGGGG